MAKYIINKTIIFDSTTAKLSFTDIADTRSTSLSTHAARCLEHLIALQGEVVTKEALLANSWKCFGFEVTDNSVNQVIFQIRKSFHYLDMGKDIIMTIPKLGYQFNPDYHLDIQSESASAAGQPHETFISSVPSLAGPKIGALFNKYRIVMTAACVTSALHFLFGYSEQWLEKQSSQRVGITVCEKPPVDSE